MDIAKKLDHINKLSMGWLEAIKKVERLENDLQRAAYDAHQKFLCLRNAMVACDLVPDWVPVK